MNEHIVMPPSLLSGRPLAKADAVALAKTGAPEWTVAYVGPKELPIAQFKHVEPMKVLSNLLIELGWLNDRRLVGRMVLPKGLRPKDGARVKVDDEPLGERLAFEAVQSGENMARLNWEEQALAMLSSGEILSVHAVTASRKKPVTFKIPLKNFSSTIDRLKEAIEKRNSKTS